MPARIVVVDDDEALRNAVGRALRLEGYVVEVAADGAEGLTRLAGVDADVVVLDVLMPVLDGITVCRRLREMGNRTPVLMLTARLLGSPASPSSYPATCLRTPSSPRSRSACI